jgi:hypothetical protein
MAWFHLFAGVFFVGFATIIRNTSTGWLKIPGFFLFKGIPFAVGYVLIFEFVVHYWDTIKAMVG